MVWPNDSCSNHHTNWLSTQMSCVEIMVMYGNVLFTKIIPLIKWAVIVLIATRVVSKVTMGVCKSNMCMMGKTVIITGANAGLGYQTALVLAGRGARVIMADCVDTSEAKKRIIYETDNTNVVCKYLDLASLQSVRDFAAAIIEEEERLDILINNAGVGAINDKYTNDGLQVQIQINHFGPFLLTHLLINLLKRSAPSRIVFLSSVAAFFEDLSLETLNKTCKTNGGFNNLYTYGNTKLLSLITSNCFADKLNGTGVTSNAVHPGLVSTALYRTLLGPKTNNFIVYLIYLILRICGKDVYEGAQTQLYCALSKDLDYVSGRFFVDCKLFIQPKKARNAKFCEEIWQNSEFLVKLRDDEKI